MKDGILRVIDANLNRSREGLRVCEDVTRFILDSASLSGELKALRHGITGASKGLPSKQARMLGSRDAASDVGRFSRLATEMKRAGPGDIFMANIQRVKESLRVLEEFGKLVDAGLAMKFRRLRFRAYEVEKKVVARLYPLRDTRRRAAGR